MYRDQGWHHCYLCDEFSWYRGLYQDEKRNCIVECHDRVCAKCFCCHSDHAPKEILENRKKILKEKYELKKKELEQEFNKDICEVDRRLFKNSKN
jgi:hypothetical protein